MISGGRFVGVVAAHRNLAEAGDLQHEQQFVLEVHLPVQGVRFRCNQHAGFPLFRPHFAGIALLQRINIDDSEKAEMLAAIGCDTTLTVLGLWLR